MHTHLILSFQGSIHWRVWPSCQARGSYVGEADGALLRRASSWLASDNDGVARQHLRRASRETLHINSYIYAHKLYYQLSLYPYSLELHLLNFFSNKTKIGPHYDILILYRSSLVQILIMNKFTTWNSVNAQDQTAHFIQDWWRDSSLGLVKLVIPWEWWDQAK
jgi:hypothetical protein